MNLFLTFIKGMWIGGTLTVPGVSGGTMAMILGLYEKLIFAFNSLFRKQTSKKDNILFLSVFSLGGFCGILAISGAIIALLKNHPLSMTFLFSGVVLGGIRSVFREVKKNVFCAADVVYPLIGVAAVLSIASLPSQLISFDKNDPLQWILQLVVGILAAAALILPGISISQFLYVFGMYELIIGRILNFEFLSLIPFIIGIVLGIVCMAKMLEDLMLRFKKECYLVILGFIIGSVIELMKSASFVGFGFHCILLFLIGFILMFMISKERKKDQGLP